MRDSIKPSSNRKWLGNLLALGFWLALWQVLAMLLGQQMLLVSPIDAVKKLFELMGTAGFYQAVLSTLSRILTGFLLALTIGGLLGILSHLSSFVSTLLHPPMATISATPVASFVILVLFMIKKQANLSIYISFLMVLPLIYLAVQSGLGQADPKLLGMAKVFRLTGFQKARAIYLPALMPQLLTACRVGLGMCWKAGLAAEVIAPPNRSIGEALYRSKIFWATDELFAWTLAVILLSVAFEKLALMGIRALGRRFEEG